MKKFLFILIANIFVLAGIFIIGEIIFRLAPSLTADPVPPPPWNSRETDDVFGWHVKENYRYEGTMKDAAGKEFPDTLVFNKDGFRAFGNTNPPDSVVKIFFVGDSYTQSLEVSNNKLFYNLLKKNLPVEVFAYGAAGYGNLQEYLIVKKYLPLIKPDIVVLQLCDNDYMDNYAPLEAEANYRVGMTRPYLSADDSIYYSRCWLPHKHLRQYSRFLYYLVNKWENMKEKKYGAPVFPAERLIAETDTAYAPFNASIKITGMILKRFKDLEKNGIKVVVFQSDNFHPQSTHFKQLCEKNGIPFIEGVGSGIEQAQNSGKVVHAIDGYHWSETGHQLIADTLSNKLRPYVQQVLSGRKH